MNAADDEFLLRSPQNRGSEDFRLLAESLSHMVWVCRADGTLDYLNTHGRDYFGNGPSDSIGPFPSEASIHPEDRERAARAWHRVVDTHESLNFEARLRRFDGAFRWHLIRAQPVRNAEGTLVKWIGTAVNIQDVREAPDISAFLLQLSTDFARTDSPHELVCMAMSRLRERLGTARVALAEIDDERAEALILRQGGGDGSYLEVASLPLKPFDDLVHEAKEGFVTVLRDVRKDTRPAATYDQWYGVDGVGAVITAPLLQGGELVALLAVVETIPRNWTAAEVEMTRRVADIVWPALQKARADRELAASEQRLRLTQAVAQIGTWQLDPQSRTLFLSSESCDLFGFTAQEPDPYECWMSGTDPRDRHKLDDLARDCGASGVSEAEYRYRHPVRGLRWIHSRAGVVGDATKRYVVGINLDVTERRQAEEALREVSQRKDEFLAMLGHELRNPLAPIRNAARILRAYSTGKPQLEWARTVIERQTRHLARLVDDLLDVSRMMRGQIVLRRAAIEVPELIELALETSRPLIRARHHRLHVDMPEAPLKLEGDLTRLAQVVANLLNNAAKYMDEGGDIWLTARSEGEHVVLRVRDNGPGIPLDLLPRIFELFAQAERALDRAQGGLGIGLTLVKRLVEMHGGTVVAANVEPGKGAEFTVRLPNGFAGEPARQPAEAESGPKAAPGHDEQRRSEAAMRVLIVDDNIDAADSIAMLLTIEGFTARSVHSAAEALDVVGSFQPHVVLLDIGLPLMNGYEVARRLRSQTTAESMKLIALSGYGQQADRDRAAQAGFDDYLVKPVEPALLSRLLRSLR